MTKQTTHIPATLSTTFHVYSFDTNTAEGKEAWRLFKLERQSDGARIHGPVHTEYKATAFDRQHDGETVTLETAHLFDNQWNATFPDGSGMRVFDWRLESEQSHPSSTFGAPLGIKRGHYLDMTQEIAAARRDTLKCGYCGNYQHVSEADTFCPACIGSQYISADVLHLTRMVSVSDGSDDDARPPLEGAEKAEREAAMVEAKREGMKTPEGARMAKLRVDAVAKAEKARTKAETERDGILWLLDHDLGGLAADNAIFYGHTGRFGFGWRNALTYAAACELMGKLSDDGFPFPYDVETSDRGKLSGAISD